MSKISLPPGIKAEMDAWKRELPFRPVPGSYINWHMKLADIAIVDPARKWLVHSTWLDDDGWVDGMRVVHAVVEHRPTETLHKIKWSDSNQDFMYRCKGGGWMNTPTLG